MDIQRFIVVSWVFGNKKSQPEQKDVESEISSLPTPEEEQG